MSEESHGVRIDRVEAEVGAIRTHMDGLKTDMGRVQADVKGLGGILTRIENGVLRAQEQQDQREQQSRHSPVAIATVLVTFMSILIAGSWTIGSQGARTEVRLNDQDTQMSRLLQQRDRELDTMQRRIDRVEDKEWHGAEPVKASE